MLRIPGGYILLSRRLIESEIMQKPPLYLKVWVWLLLKATHTNYGTLRRGQLRTSIAEIQVAMTHYVGFRRVAPSRKEIFGIIEWLRNTCKPDCHVTKQSGFRNPDEGNRKGTMMVTTKVTHGFIVTIENYERYQNPKNYEGNGEGNDESPMKVHGGEQYKQELKTEKNILSSNLDGAPSSKPKPPYQDIVAYLNEKTGKSFNASTGATRSLIDARWAEGHREEDFKRVIDTKSTQWLGDEQEKFLRPQTLFGTKFEAYLNEIGRKQARQADVPTPEPEGLDLSGYDYGVN